LCQHDKHAMALYPVLGHCGRPECCVLGSRGDRIDSLMRSVQVEQMRKARFLSHLLTLAHDPETPYGVEVGRAVRLSRSDFMPSGERVLFLLDKRFQT